MKLVQGGFGRPAFFVSAVGTSSRSSTCAKQEEFRRAGARPYPPIETFVVFLSFPTHYMLWSHVTG
jgi:hypothetical protein